MADDVKAQPDLEQDVRSVLADIGAAEAVAQLEARIDELEQDIERADTRAAEAARGRTGELDVMRARIDDALTLVGESLEDQRSLWSRLEQRLTEVAADADSVASAAVRSLREDLHPKVERTTLQADEVEARLAGQLESAVSELRGRLEGADETMAATRAALEHTLEELRAGQVDASESATAALSEVEARLVAKLDEAQAELAARHDEVGGRVDALRRELDGTAGELRASFNLKAQESDEQLAALRTEVAETLQQQSAAAAELERRWIEGTREIAMRLESFAVAARDAVREEKVARDEALHAARAELEAVQNSLQEIEGRVSNEAARTNASIEEVRRGGAEVTARLATANQRIESLAAEVSNTLTNRVGSLVAEVEALREASVRQEQQTAGMSNLGPRVGELAARLEAVSAEASASADDTRVVALEEKLGGIRKDLATLAGGVGAAVEQTQAASSRVGQIADVQRRQEQLATEVRELTAKNAELTARLEETDRLARAAGQAIASAVRRARTATPSPAPVPPLAPGAPSVEAAERSPLFQGAPEPPEVPS